MNKTGLIIALAIISLVAGVFVQFWLKPDFKTVAGENYQWREFQGQWVVVNYFAEWCAPCLKEVPELNEFHAKSDTPIFGISYDAEPDAKMQEIAAKYNMLFPIISAESDHQLPMTRPGSLPATYIIDGEGQVRKTLMGEQSYEKLQKTVALLKGL